VQTCEWLSIRSPRNAAGDGGSEQEGEMMSGILCAIRGGPASQGPIELGIQLAKQTGERLHFLFVVNLDFLKMTETSRTQVLSEEMRGLGEFILLTAQAKADKSGVIADGSVRQGAVMEEIVALAKELEVSHIVLGRPRLEEQANVFTLDRLHSFVEFLEEETGSKVMLAESGGEE
jgi:nucleotide-binding universal stress UspA family protein